MVCFDRVGKEIHRQGDRYVLLETARATNSGANLNSGARAPFV